MNRRTALITLATLATSVTLPVAAAQAVAPVLTDAAVFTADTDGDGSYGVYRLADGGSRTTVLPEDVNTDVNTLTVARDGSRFAYVQDRYSSDGSSDTAQIVVREANGALVRVVDPITSRDTDTGFIADAQPALSPDGTELVFTRLQGTDTGFSFTLRRVNLGTGAVSVVSGGSDHAAWAYLTPTTLISINGVTGASGSIVTLPVAGGASTPVSGLDPAGDGEFSVSPDGSRIAWTHFTTASDATVGTSDIKIADLSVSDTGAATLSNVVTRVTGLENSSPTWTHDGSSLRFVRYDGDIGPGDLWTVPSTGTSDPTQSVTAGVDEIAVGNVVTDDTAPAGATAQPFTLAGTSARIAWTLPTGESDLAGVSITRTGGAGAKTFRAPAPATSIVDTGLTVGTTYTYAISAVDHSGNLAPASTRQLTAIKPFATFPDPTSTSYYTSPAFRVYLPAQGTYTVQVRTNGTGPLTTWYSGSGASHVYTAAKAGYSYGFLVTSTDGFGNSSAPTGAGTAVVPYDQTKASFSGSYLTQALSGRYLGSATLLRAAGAAARITVNGNRLQLIGERCASCGVMDVYVDGTRVAGIDTRASARQARQVLYTRSLTAGNHAIVVKARGTAGRPNVVLDGFGVRH